MNGDPFIDYNLKFAEGFRNVDKGLEIQSTGRARRFDSRLGSDGCRRKGIERDGGEETGAACGHEQVPDRLIER